MSVWLGTCFVPYSWHNLLSVFRVGPVGQKTTTDTGVQSGLAAVWQQALQHAGFTSSSNKQPADHTATYRPLQCASGPAAAFTGPRKLYFPCLNQHLNFFFKVKKKNDTRTHMAEDSHSVGVVVLNTLFTFYTLNQFTPAVTPRSHMRVVKVTLRVSWDCCDRLKTLSGRKEVKVLATKTILKCWIIITHMHQFNSNSFTGKNNDMLPKHIRFIYTVYITCSIHYIFYTH